LSGSVSESSFRIAARIAVIVLLILYWLALFVGTHLPPGVGGGVEIPDKVLHFSGFAGLGGLLAFAAPNRRWRTLLACWLLAVGYGAVDELTQPIVGRDDDIWDFVADTAGAFCGVAVGALVRKQFNRWLISVFGI